MNKKGSILLSLMFTILLSMLGIALMTSSVAHLKITRARDINRNMRQHLYNSLFRYLHNSRIKIEEIVCNSEYSDNITELFNEKFFPDIKKSGINLESRIETGRNFREFYTIISGELNINATDARTGFRYENSNRFKIYKGDLPIDLFRVLQFGKKNIFPGKNRTGDSFQSNSKMNNVPDSKYNIIFDIKKFLKENFRGRNGIYASDILKGEDNNVFPGLEKNIYLFSDNRGNCSILINTDPDNIILSAMGKLQVITVEKNLEKFRIEYEPGEDFTNILPALDQIPGKFSEKMIVNGNILKLSGNNDQTFSSGTGLELVVFGSTTLDGSLKSMSKKKFEHTPLKLFCICNPYKSTDNCNTNIKISEGGEGIFNISLFSGGKLIKGSSNLTIKGTVAASEIINPRGLKVLQSQTTKLTEWIRVKKSTLLGYFITDYIEPVEN